MQRFKTHLKGISKLLLILLLLVSAVIGGLIAYTWTMGYIVVLYSAPPEGTMIEISNMTFPKQNATYFEVTFFNPSTSKENATITKIAITTKGSAVFEEVYTTSPTLPYVLPKGEKRTFTCVKYWGDYAGKEIGVVAFVNEGTGSAAYKSTEYVKLEADALFNSTRSVEWFTVTVRNNADSKIALNLTRIYVDIVEIPAANVTPSLGSLAALQASDSVTLNCTYNWESLMGFNHTLKVGTAQGYKAETSTGTLPSPLELTIVSVQFNQTIATDHFNVTIQNGSNSPHYVTVTRIDVFHQNGTRLATFQIAPTAINVGSVVLITCQETGLNWLDWKAVTSKIKIVAYTLQGFKTSTYEFTFPT